MYRKILFCLDNSDYANSGVEAGLRIAEASRATVAGCHVYAARLHSERFKEMEGGLPAEYRAEEKLKEQREIHEGLIEKGLRIISDSYIAPFLARAEGTGLKALCISREGKNFEEIVKEAEENAYDLVVMGAHGLGKTEFSRIGSVVERVARRIKCDLLIMKDASYSGPSGDIAVAIDGSPASFGAMNAAICLSKFFNTGVEAVSAFDPDFHRTAFRSIAGVLSDEAGRLFRFKEQEKLHDEIIDSGLARIYASHLESAVKMAGDAGITLKTTLLSGKASAEIIRHCNAERPFILALGRTGAHAVPSLDIGSVAENCLREAPCNILITSKEAALPQTAASGVEWDAEAEKLLSSIPSFIRQMVRKMAEDAARKDGVETITPQYMRKVRERMGND
ncbi:MAG: universal stress protein [Deltaproteobacteria bacterium]|nr:universal stress protein [Deltaproteobacteria bacterium]